MAKPRGSILRGVSRHRSYTLHEAASALGVSRGTIGRWLKAGLPAITDRKPFLILGEDLIQFRGRRTTPKQKCRLTECYCFKCRAPRAALGNMADLTIGNGPTGNLQALCCNCGTLMHKRLSLRRLSELNAEMDVAVRQAD